MRHPNKNDLIVLFAGAAVLAMWPSLAGAITVGMDENTVLELRAPAGNVVIGNPSIADVNLITPQKLMVLGRSYGLTNLIVTDRTGRTIFQQEINVSSATRGRVSLYRGPLVANFACSPRCERTPMPGEDATNNYEPYANGYKGYGDRARTESGSEGAGAQ